MPRSDRAGAYMLQATLSTLPAEDAAARTQSTQLIITPSVIYDPLLVREVNAN